MRNLSVAGAVALAIVLFPSAAAAYVGPGGIITAIGAFFALLFALVAAFAGFIWLPLKRLLIWLRSRRKGELHSGVEEMSETEVPEAQGAGTV